MMQSGETGFSPPFISQATVSHPEVSQRGCEAPLTRHRIKHEGTLSHGCEFFDKEKSMPREAERKLSPDRPALIATLISTSMKIGYLPHTHVNDIAPRSSGSILRERGFHLPPILTSS